MEVLDFFRTYSKNKFFNDSLRYFYYLAGYSTSAGLGNGLRALSKCNEFIESFVEGASNNLKLAIFTNLLYPLLFPQFKKSQNYRLYANLYVVGMSTVLLGWHYYSGTDNPMATATPLYLGGIILANLDVSKTKNLEDFIQNN